MDRTSLELEPGLWLDAAGAVWLPGDRILAAADLHLGYAWTHRHGGNLLPLTAPDDTAARLLDLVERYEPRELVLLGDIVHGTTPLEPMKEVLCGFFDQLSARVPLRFITGNHDAQLPKLLQACGLPSETARELRAGPHLLRHGDGMKAEMAAAQLAAVRDRAGRLIIGHEHPAIHLSDGVATSAKCRCFVFSKHLLILPAFSAWSSGTNVRSAVFMSSCAKIERMEGAVAIVAGKLLILNL